MFLLLSEVSRRLTEVSFVQTRDLMQTLVQSSPALVKQLYDHIPAESRIETDHLSVIISLAYAGDGIAVCTFTFSLFVCQDLPTSSPPS